MLRHLLLDLDETLYSAETGLWPAIRERINLFMIERLQLPPAEVPALRHRYYEQYGTSLMGLQNDFQVDAAEYLAFVHDLPLAQYLQPDSALNAMLARVPLQKSVFTNADAAHAQRVLAHLGIAQHITHIIDITALDFISKPAPGAYARALEIVGARAAECAYADDALRNLIPARALGMTTIHVGHAPENLNGADYHVPTVHGLERVLASLIGHGHF